LFEEIVAIGRFCEDRERSIGTVGKSFHVVDRVCRINRRECPFVLKIRSTKDGDPGLGLGAIPIMPSITDQYVLMSVPVYIGDVERTDTT
jgi:hypothetical protein